jgi:hypothetical protein
MSSPEPTSPSSFDLAFTVAALVFVVLAVAMALGDFALGAALNGWQRGLTGGRSFPFLSAMLLSIALVVPVFVVKAVVVRMRAK